MARSDLSDLDIYRPGSGHGNGFGFGIARRGPRFREIRVARDAVIGHCARCPAMLFPSQDARSDPNTATANLNDVNSVFGVDLSVIRRLKRGTMKSSWHALATGRRARIVSLCPSCLIVRS